MLIDLQISNFALIASQSISFGPGLNVISGESGVGKSLILSALQFVMGGKLRAETVRSGAECAEVQAVFDLQGLQGLDPERIAALPDIAKAEELVLARSLSSQGRSKVYINGKLGTVSLLEEIAAVLINFCGQHQHVQLLDSRFHLQLIDNYAQNQPLLQQCREAHLTWRKANDRLGEARRQEESSSQRQEELKEIISEIQTLNLTSTLREDLEQRVKTLGAAERILEHGSQATSALSSDALLMREVQQALALLIEIGKADPQTQRFVDQLQNIKHDLRELAGEVDRYLSGVTIDNEALESAREQLAELSRLLRKYKTDCSGLLQLLEASRQELEQGCDLDFRAKLEAETARLEEERNLLAEKLSAERKKAVAKLVKEVPADFADLGMKGVRFEIDSRRVEPGPHGQDEVEILFSANKGHPLRPLKEIASGGELSRVTLVLKKNLRDSTGVNVLVFDEIDSGVSGGVARGVGEKLKELASYSQVICITHLPQIASLADHHFLVDKIMGKQASSIIREISDTERVEEIARMLAGYEVTKASRESARELLSSKSR